MIEKLKHFVESPKVTGFVLGVILFNALLLGLDTSKTVTTQFGHIIDILDTVCLGIFTFEIILKLIVYRLAFFKSGWNIFDFIIVGIALVPAAQSLSALRALRIMRLFRVVSISPSLRKVVGAFMAALPGMGSVIILISVIFYISSVITTKLFGASHPEFFGTLGGSAYSLFQIMTLESWSMGIVRPVMEVHPQAWAFFVPFILVTTFSVVNLVVGLIVDAMQVISEEEDNKPSNSADDEVLKRLDAIEKVLKDISQK